MDRFTLSAGHIRTDPRVGAREGGAIDDYFNPFNEGDSVYQPDARTWYGGLSYESGAFNTGLVFGRTEYRDDSRPVREEELDISAKVMLFDHLSFEALVSFITSWSPERDSRVMEFAVTYDF